ncbi:hypothetical protein A3752_16610 [Oleiphilus sp. HI0081]|jgi:adhesin transport system outer membrane protein|nr:hypothetical protein A3732_10595 [Oleiphilus sp. HI0050]KZZ10170.1 hypothetical protein A3749_11815 [Oleiphilus sp. HI0078]KZZ18713.1 hypothetical protein A3752_16610 [Oleiphilus sp. HI0081]KZZ39161.1 hypothetical protein A3757_06900 [Oleiphilus sp. HI0117]KZZ55497.1 hypothetical protein A3761_11505 [Oleiphilus sp. HI0123]
MQFLSRLFLCLAVTGCFSVAPVFSQELDSSFSNTIDEPGLSKKASAVRGIQESVSLTLASHPQLKAMVSELYAQMADIEERESAFLPKLVLSLGVGREHSNNTSTRSLTGSGSEQMERREASLALRQMLFDGFQTHWQRESGVEMGQARRLAMRSQAETLAYDAVQAHLDVMRANFALEDHIANLQTHERIAKDVGMRARLGKDDRAKVSQVSARLSLSLANVEAAKAKLRAAEAAYFRVVGSRPALSLAFSPGLLSMPNSLEQLLEEVSSQNPQLLSEARALRASKAERSAAKSTNLPSIYLESGASWNDNLDGVKGRNNDAFVMLRMQYDLFNGGRDSAAKNKAALRVKRAVYRMEDAQRELSLAAEQAWHRYQSLSTRYALLQDYAESAENTKRAYIKQFDIGQRSLIDLLDAENELLNAKRLSSEARYDLYLIKYELLYLQGSLLDHLSQNITISPKVTKFLDERA